MLTCHFKEPEPCFKAEEKTGVLLGFGKCAGVQEVTVCADTAAARPAEHLTEISLHWKCRGT